MSKTKEALKMALDALEISLPARCDQSDELYLAEREKHGQAIAAIREALAEQEPAEGRWYRADEIDAFARDIDIALHGDGAAPKPMLCDVMPSLMKMLTEQEQEPIGYMAFRDGKPSWDEDCVCKDAVYPVDRDDDRVSVAIYTHAAPANQPSVPRDDIELAMQMLTWGRDEGLTAEQDKQVLAHQKKLHAMLAAAPEAPAWQELSKAERKPLTDEQIDDLWAEHENGSVFDVHDFARAIESAHGIGESK